MQIECRFFGPFRDDVGAEQVEFETDAATYGELLRELEREFPVLEGRLIEEEGDNGASEADEGADLAGEVAVTRNRTNIRHHEGLETPVEPDDVVRMIPSVYGG
ncbi:MoaD/ThiS family protein [Haloparvum sp. AD34]